MLLISATVFMTILASFLVGIAVAYYFVMALLWFMRANDRRQTPKQPEQVLVTT